MDRIQEIVKTDEGTNSEPEILKLCDIDEDEWNYSPNMDKNQTSSNENVCISDTSTLEINTNTLDNIDYKNKPSKKQRRFGIFYIKSRDEKDCVSNGNEAVDIEQISELNDVVRKKSWLLFRSMGNIPNPEVFKCKRFHFRRNAICDPFNLLMPQKHREVTEKAAQKRKGSVFRRIKIFFQVQLNIDGEEDL
uniref:Uncharacterized protein n=1 Tax=Octopus bimaculoides TaxID=37653 RepID=A0A0L8G9M8_OCTBM